MTTSSAGKGFARRFAIRPAASFSNWRRCRFAKDGSPQEPPLNTSAACRARFAFRRAPAALPWYEYAWAVVRNLLRTERSRRFGPRRIREDERALEQARRNHSAARGSARRG